MRLLLRQPFRRKGIRKLPSAPGPSHRRNNHRKITPSLLPEVEPQLHASLAEIRGIAHRDPDQAYPVAAEIDTRDGPTMTRIAAAMARVENGVEPDEAEIAEGWRLFSADF